MIIKSKFYILPLIIIMPIIKFTLRTFISIDPGIQTKIDILELQRIVKKEVLNLSVKYLNSIRWEAQEKFHITLFFIGEVSEAQLKDIIIGLKEIESQSVNGKLNFTAKGINAFPKLKYPRVLFLDLENEDKKVFELSDKLNSNLRKLGIISDKTFHPHITLGRVRRDHKIDLSELENSVKTDLKFSAKNFYLMKSDLRRGGSEYSVIEKFMI